MECGDALSSHDFSALVGYSASGIFPYEAHAQIAAMAQEGDLADASGRALNAQEAIANYNRAAVARMVGIMSKMGISTAQSYHSAQIFEAVGLADGLINRHFTGTVSRVGGLDLPQIQDEMERRYDAAQAITRSPAPDQLRTLGLTTWRPLDGEDHLIDPQTIYLLQRAVRTDSAEDFAAYSARLHRPGRCVRLRDLLDFNATGRTPLPLDQVESARSIATRFNTGAMSYGSISQEAHECMAIAMNRLHGRSNSGEGGEDPRRETPLANGDSKNSAIKQVASGRFGVTSRYLASATGSRSRWQQQVPSPARAATCPARRYIPGSPRYAVRPPGIGLISPPHHDIYSIEDLAELHRSTSSAPTPARVSASSWSARQAWAPSPPAWPRALPTDLDQRPQRRVRRRAARLHLACGPAT